MLSGVREQIAPVSAQSSASAGFIGLVYAVGGGVLALRLYLAHLPSRTIVGQLLRDQLTSVGLTQVVLPVPAVVAFYAAYRLLRGATPPPQRLVRQWTERSWRAWTQLIGGSAVPAFAVAGSIALGAKSGGMGSKQLLWLDPVEKLSLLAFLVGEAVVLGGRHLLEVRPDLTEAGRSQLHRPSRSHEGSHSRSSTSHGHGRRGVRRSRA
jgi:hypothetical protein